MTSSQRNSATKVKRLKVKGKRKNNLGQTPDIVARTFRFALAIIRLAGELDGKSSPQRVLSNQVLRSGTSVGANVEEAQAAESRADFIHKYNIALKEADEICRIIAQIIINARKKK